MQGGSMHLRRRREMHAGRRSTRSRLSLFGGGVVLIVGVACLAPLAPTALAPATLSSTSAMVAPTQEAAVAPRPIGIAPGAGAPQVGVPVVPAVVPPLPAP